MKLSTEDPNLIKVYLEKLAVEIGERHVGSDSNRQAVDFFYNVVSAFDYDVQKDEFCCLEWECGEVYLAAEHDQYLAF